MRNAESRRRPSPIGCIAIAFLGSAISAAILPWRRPDIYNASPIAKYKVAGVPLITAAATLFTAIHRGRVAIGSPARERGSRHSPNR